MKMRKNYRFLRFSLALLWCFGITWFAYAQGTVNGNVTDENGEPLPGVSVVFKGTTTGTTTDFDGNYRLNVPSGATTLIFSYVGYLPKEVEIGGQSTINIQMEIDVETLSEVVVVGYGTQDKKEITSSVASISSEDFNGGNVNDVSQLLQGKVAGLTIARAGSNPSGGFNIRLRGLSTVGQNTSPLIVIDGVIGADLNSVDPNDIETIDILKDGSAAAIYGTRGSAGVILVTTKQGKAGRTKVDYNGYVSAENVARTVQVMDRDEFLSRPGNVAVDEGADTDWYDEITRTAISHVHNLALSGGTEKTTYRASMNYRAIDGVSINSGFRQLNGRLNLTQKALNDKLTLTTNLAVTTRNSDFGFDQAFRYAAIYNPTAPVRSDDPEFAPFGGYFEKPLFDYFNPVAMLEQNVNEGKRKILNMAFQADYDIVEGLRATVRYGTQTENNFNGWYISKEAFWNGPDGRAANGLGRAQRRTDESFNELFEATLNYDKTFGDVNLSLLGGYSYQEFVFEGHGATAGNFLTDAFSYNNLGAALDFDNGLGDVFSYKNNYKLVGFFGRINLNYQGTYFFSASARQEGSTRFGDGNKWGLFPAVSAGVTISNLVDIPMVDNLKFRASYGVTGSIPGESYLSLSTLVSGGTFFYDGAFVPSFSPARNENPDLGWETKAEIDFGLDFAMFDNRLTGTMDYYSRTTTDLIYNATVPVPPNITDRKFLNVGEFTSNGFEFAANFLAVDNGNFTWTPGVNFSTFNVELTSLSNDEFDFGGEQLISNLGSPGQNNTNLIRIAEGEPFGQIWGLVYDGLNEDGTWRFRDLNGDGTINEADEQVIGNGLPDFQIGITNSFTFGNFDFNFLLRGAFGHDLVNTYRAFYELPQLATYNVVKTDLYNENLTETTGRYSSLHVENASYIRLDNFTLGYSFKLPENSPVTKARLYLSGQNLFYITDYTGADPEVRFDDAGDILAPGIDRRNTWARTRTFVFGANISF